MSIEENSTKTTSKSAEIHTECLEGLATDAGINIKEMILSIKRDEGTVDESHEEIAAQAGELGVKVYKETVESGMPLTVAEMEAFKSAIPGRQWKSYEEWKVELETDISQALDDYCPTGTCKQFI